MDGYGAADPEASYAGHYQDDGRSHRSNRDRDYERYREDRDRDRDSHRRHRDRDERDRDDRHRGEREYRSSHSDRYADRDRRDRDRDRERERYAPYDREDRRRRDDGAAEPMGGYGRRPRHEDDGGYAAPMRGYDRPPRRDDRDDWRGAGGNGYGGHGNGRSRDGGRGGGRRNSPPREPTPPGTVPLEERVIPYTMWDVRPPQFEGISGMEAKMTGMFTYGPGRVPPPAHLSQPQPPNASPFDPGFIGFITPARQAKRLYVANTTEETDGADLRATVEKLMHERGLAADRPGDVVELVHVNNEKHYAVIEFRSAAEATAALALDGTEYGDSALSLKKPEDYIGIDPTLGSGDNSGSPNKLFIGGLPTHLNEEQVSELLKSFGEIKSFNLVKELIDGEMVSKGFAFCEYADPAVTDLAIQGLNNFQLGDRMLVVQRADTTRPTAAPTGAAIPGTTNFLNSIQDMLAEAKVEPEKLDSRCMVMLNMVEPDELRDDEEYADILADIKDECSKFGTVEGVRVPRPVPKAKTWEPSDTAATRAEKNRKADEENGVGRVYVMYRDVADVQRAMQALGGRQFASRTILVASVSEDEFMGPAPPPPPALPPPPEEPQEYQPPAPPAAAPPPPRDLDAQADDLLKDIMG